MPNADAALLVSDSSVGEVMHSLKRGTALFGGLDTRPGARADAFGHGAHLSRAIQPCLDSGCRIDRRVAQDPRINKRIGGKIVVTVMQLVRDICDHPGLKYEIQKLIRSVKMRRADRN